MERVRDAATVILVRRDLATRRTSPRNDLQVFVLRRNPALVFVPGATVFPGGAVDPVDAPVAAELGVDEFRAAAAARVPGGVRHPDRRARARRVRALDHARRRAPPLRHALLRRRAPDGHEGEHDGSELVASAWMRPGDVLRAFADG